MKKLVILLFWGFSYITCFAELPNGLMGVQLGFSKMQVDSVIATLPKVKIKTCASGAIEVSGKLIFEGINWKTLRIRMYNGEVSEVQLEKSKMYININDVMELIETYGVRYAQYYKDMQKKIDSYGANILLSFSDGHYRHLRVSYNCCSEESLHLTLY